LTKITKEPHNAAVFERTSRDFFTAAQSCPSFPEEFPENWTGLTHLNFLARYFVEHFAEHFWGRALLERF
jgi:hypothetical protein